MNGFRQRRLGILCASLEAIGKGMLGLLLGLYADITFWVHDENVIHYEKCFLMISLAPYLD